MADASIGRCIVSWARLDDRLHDSKEFNGLSDGAMALWVRLQSRVAAIESDGTITQSDLDRVDMSRAIEDRQRVPITDIVAELVSRKLLAVSGDEWLDPGWLRRNPSADETELNRQWGNLRVQKSRARARKDHELEAAVDEQIEAVKDSMFAARGRRETRHGRSMGKHVSTPVTTREDIPDTRSETSSVQRPDPSRPKEGRGKTSGRSAPPLRGSAALPSIYRDFPASVGSKQPVYATAPVEYSRAVDQIYEAWAKDEDWDVPIYSYCAVCGRMYDGAEATQVRLEGTEGNTYIHEECTTHPSVERVL